MKSSDLTICSVLFHPDQFETGSFCFYRAIAACVDWTFSNGYLEHIGTKVRLFGHGAMPSATWKQLVDWQQGNDCNNINGQNVI